MSTKVNKPAARVRVSRQQAQRIRNRAALFQDQGREPGQMPRLALHGPAPRRVRIFYHMDRTPAGAPKKVFCSAIQDHTAVICARISKNDFCKGIPDSAGSATERSCVYFGIVRSAQERCRISPRGSKFEIRVFVYWPG